ncbi:MAG: FAD-dependent oxidoreductase [Pirellulales bacterium]|nr:FAD-dependent oxidoreductase [Pirellulales bacterium]
MDPAAESFDVAVVGAGMAGLSAARALVDAGRSVVVFDKGRGIGGRMATRRLGAAVFDHGAQYFSVRSRGFGDLVAEASDNGQAAIWSHGFPMLDASGAMELPGEGHPRWCGRPGMTAIPKRMAAGLDVRTASRVVAVRREAGRVVLRFDEGPSIEASAAVLTPPVPQTLDLLDAGGVVIEPAERTRLDAIDYEPCFALMAVLAHPSKLPPPGGLSLEAGPIAWIADNQQKGISPLPAITIHSSPGFSREHFDDEPAGVAAQLLAAAERWIEGGAAGVVEQSLQRWKFARPVLMFDAPLAVVSREPPIVLAGDAFVGQRVEAAVTSGAAAARWLLRG